jgi:hypothetical protein
MSLCRSAGGRPIIEIVNLLLCLCFGGSRIFRSFSLFYRREMRAFSRLAQALHRSEKNAWFFNKGERYASRNTFNVGCCIAYRWLQLFNGP